MLSRHKNRNHPASPFAIAGVFSTSLLSKVRQKPPAVPPARRQKGSIPEQTDEKTFAASAGSLSGGRYVIFQRPCAAPFPAGAGCVAAHSGAPAADERCCRARHAPASAQSLVADRVGSGSCHPPVPAQLKRTACLPFRLFQQGGSVSCFYQRGRPAASGPRGPFCGKPPVLAAEKG